MFNESAGQVAFNDLYVFIIERNDVSSWFPRNTGTDYGLEWAAAAEPWLETAGGEVVSDLMAMLAKFVEEHDDVYPCNLKEMLLGEFKTALGYELGCYHYNRLNTDEMNMSNTYRYFFNEMEG